MRTWSKSRSMSTSSSGKASIICGIDVRRSAHGQCLQEQTVTESDWRPEAGADLAAAPARTRPAAAVGWPAPLQRRPSAPFAKQVRPRKAPNRPSALGPHLHSSPLCKWQSVATAISHDLQPTACPDSFARDADGGAVPPAKHQPPPLLCGDVAPASKIAGSSDVSRRRSWLAAFYVLLALSLPISPPLSLSLSLSLSRLPLPSSSQHAAARAEHAQSQSTDLPSCRPAWHCCRTTKNIISSNSSGLRDPGRPRRARC